MIIAEEEKIIVEEMKGDQTVMEEKYVLWYSQNSQQSLILSYYNPFRAFRARISLELF